MPYSTIACARCAAGNHPSNRFCTGCGLPMGSAQPDADAATEALGSYEPPDPAESDLDHEGPLRDFVARAGFESDPARHGWRLIVPLNLDRRQAVYLGHAGTGPDGRALLTLVSVCGPANDRDARILLRLNARAVEGHFAIRVLRGEEYFVVIQNVSAVEAPRLDAAGLVRRIAEAADSLEDRLSRGRDLF